MAQLTVRNLDDSLVRLLEQRAASRGHSAEEELREILQTALGGQPVTRRRLADFLSTIPDVGEDEDFDRLHEHPGSVDL